MFILLYLLLNLKLLQVKYTFFTDVPSKSMDADVKLDRPIIC